MRFFLQVGEAVGDAQLLLELGLLPLESFNELVLVVSLRLRPAPLAIEPGYAQAVTLSAPQGQVRAVDALSPQKLADLSPGRALVGLPKNSERFPPPIYWRAMLKGREWMAKPKVMA